MRVIKNILIALSILAATSCGVRVPQSVDAAKRKIEKNYNQIKAIKDYHDLGDPFMIRDTIISRFPSYKADFSLKTGNFDSKINTSFEKYVAPALKDGVDVQVVYRDLYRELKPEPIDETYEDSLLIVRVTGNSDSLFFDVKVKERATKTPVEYQGTAIDTEVKWYEDRFVKAIALVLVLGIAVAVILSIIRKGAV